LFLFAAPSSFPQAWSGIIDPSRAVDWSHAGVSATFPGETQPGIPTHRVQCIPSGTTSAGIAPYIGTGDTIASYVNGCPQNSYLLLQSGTFTLSSGICITASNVTLRGSGANTTFLVFTAGSGCTWGQNSDIGIQSTNFNWEQGPQNTATWTAGYTQGTTTISLGSVPNLKVGNYIILDQDGDKTTPANDFVASDNSNVTTECNDEFFAEDTNGGRGHSTTGSRSKNYGAATVSGTSSACANGKFTNRVQSQVVKLTQCDGNTTVGHACASGTNVTISPGLYAPNWNSGNNPGAWWANGQIQGTGLENLSMDHSGSASLVTGVFIWNAANCWVKNVRSIKPVRSHIGWQFSSHIEVRDSYFFGTLDGSSESYGMEIEESSDQKIENNIFQQVTTPFLQGSDSGTVFAYNYGTNDLYTSATWLIPTIDTHDGGTSYTLVEGNVGSGHWQDQIHGTHNADTDFRNYWSGTEPGKNQQTVPENINTHSRFGNYIGNVLGTAGYHTIYQTNFPGGACVRSAATAAAFQTSIWGIGWSADSGSPQDLCENGGSPAPNVVINADLLTVTSSFRWGNYSVVTQASDTPSNSGIRFVASEVPTGLTLYSNAVPANQQLPASFYLSQKPAWWNTEPWPAIGPDVSNGTVYGSNGSTSWVAQNVGGFASDIPALDCYKNIMGGPADGTGSVLPFDANNCYYAQSSPTFVQGALKPDFHYYPDQPGTTTSLAYSSPVTTGHLLWGFFAWSSTTATNTVTDSCGNTWTNVGSLIADSTYGFSAQIAYVANAIGGSACNVTMTVSAPVYSRTIMIHEVGGISTSSPLDGFGGQTNGWCGAGATDCLTTGNFTTTQNGDYIAAAMVDFNCDGAVISPGAGYMLREGPDNRENEELTSEDQVQSTASSSTVATFTPSSGGSVGIVVAAAFKHQ